MTIPFADSASNEVPELKLLVAKLLNGGAILSDVLSQADQVTPFEFLTAIQPVAKTFAGGRHDPTWTDETIDQLNKYVVKRVPQHEGVDPVALIAAANYFESCPKKPMMGLVAIGYLEQAKYNLNQEEPSLDDWTTMIVEIVEAHTHPETGHLDMHRMSTGLVATAYEDALKIQTYAHRATLSRYGEGSPEAERSSEKHDLLHAQYFAIGNGYANQGYGHVADIISRANDLTEMDPAKIRLYQAEVATATRQRELAHE